MPVTLGATPTEGNFNATNPAAPAGTTNVEWQASTAYPDPNDPEKFVRDASAYMPLMVGDSGSGGTSGAVPAPGAGDAAAGKFLKADGTWEVPSGGGGGGTPPTPVENEVVAFGTGTAGTLANTPSSVSGFTQVKLYKNGQRLTPGAGNDFTWSGTGVTLGTAALSTDVFIADYWSGSGSPATPVENEAVAFGTGTIGTLANTPSSLSGYTQVKLYKNGQRLRPGAGNDFTWSGTAVTLATAALSTDVFEADYWK